jgi:hypothetical protein
MVAFGSTLTRACLGASLLTLLAACGGGGGGGAASAPPATRLVYTSDPSATAADWRFEADPATNGTQTVVLHVYGPTGAAVQGATVFLSGDAGRTAWVQPGGAGDPYALAGSALDLAQGPDVSVQLFKSRLAGSDLQIASYQKTGTTALAADQPLFSVALDLKPGVLPGSADPHVTAGSASIYLDGTGEHPLPLKVGTLAAQ